MFHCIPVIFALAALSPTLFSPLKLRFFVFFFLSILLILYEREDVEHVSCGVHVGMRGRLSSMEKNMTNEFLLVWKLMEFIYNLDT